MSKRAGQNDFYEYFLVKRVSKYNIHQLTIFQFFFQHTNQNQKLNTKMKYFALPTFQQEKSEGILHLTEEATNLIIEICKNLKLPLQAVHLSLWLFHCQAKLISFHNFDRFSYLCAAILVGTKVGQHIRNPQDILHQMRTIIKKRKNITRQDSEEVIKKCMKRIFQAEVNIMINIGFDFDLDLSIHYLNSKLKEEIKNADLIDKVKQTLTSFYKTQIVLYFDCEIIGLTCLDIVMKNQGISVQLSGFNQALVKDLHKEQIREVRSFFINKCSII